MSLLIKNVYIGNSEEKQNVYVSGAKISSIGDVSSADTIIEGKGAKLCPGFIDIDSTSDHYLSIFTKPHQSDFVRQGVTTQVGGHCGSSLAPLLYGTLESIRKWADTAAINVDWHIVSELFESLSDRGIATNFGTFVGHSTIRRALIGEEERDLTEKEVEVYKEILDKALRQGAFGISFGLEYAHSYGTPYQELLELARVVKKHDGVLSIHLRESGARTSEAVAEVIQLAQDTDVTVLITHFMPLIGSTGTYLQAHELISKARREGVSIYATLYPFDQSVLPIYRLLPRWAQKGNLERMLAYVAKKAHQDRIADEMMQFRPEEMQVVGGSGEAAPFVGRTLEEIMSDFEIIESRRALLYLMKKSNLKAVVRFHNIDIETVHTMLKEPYVLVGSHAPSNAGLADVRSTRSIAELLRLAEEEQLLPLDEAIAKVTRMPANILGLSSRGQDIQEGNIADLVGVRDGQVVFTVVGGVPVFQEGDVFDKLPGTCIDAN